VFNLAKTILGAGILSLPSGVAAFTDNVSGLVPATGLLLAMGLISAYSFASIGRACNQHNSRSFADAWAKSVGPRSAVVISSVITFKTFFSCLAFSIIIGDSFSSIFKSFGLPALMTSRTNVILGLSSLVIFPLCMLKNMDALKTTSLLGLGGIVYCALFMVVRLLDGSYRAGGKFFNDIADAVKPSFSAKKAPVPIQQVFVLISMISTAYVAHYNAPKFWTDLKNRSTHRFHTVVASAFGFACLMYMTVMWTGFLTFG
jgi:sodium-coupled neutral amino acid transporter 11